MAEQYPGKDKVKSRIERYCILQDRCQEEVRLKLVSMGCNYSEVNDWLFYLISEGFVNEERFARSFVRGHFRMKHWGRNLIRKHLQAKKISVPNIKIALEQEIGADEYLQTIRTLLAKKERIEGLSRNKPIDAQKLIRFLIGKGFEFSSIQECLEEDNGSI
jgi:regulatory protein